MTKNQTKATTKRTVLTPAERVAKIEAELAAAKAKAEETASKKAAVLVEKRSRLLEQINERQAKVDEIEAELRQLDYKIDDHSDTAATEAPADEPTEA